MVALFVYAHVRSQKLDSGLLLICLYPYALSFGSLCVQGSSACCYPYASNSTAPLVNPPPNATKITLSPGWMVPFS